VTTTLAGPRSRPNLAEGGRIFVDVRFDCDDESGRRTVHFGPVESGDERLSKADLPAVEKVFHAVAQFEGGANIEHLRKALNGMKDKTIRNHLTKLKRAGRIVQPQQGRWSLPAAEKIPDSQSYIGSGNRESVCSGLKRLSDADPAIAYAANGLGRGARAIWQALWNQPEGMTRQEINRLFDDEDADAEEALTRLQERCVVIRSGESGWRLCIDLGSNPHYSSTLASR
jgi:DNA-binding transcriptional ArsR family regulator